MCPVEVKRVENSFQVAEKWRRLIRPLPECIRPLLERGSRFVFLQRSQLPSYRKPDGNVKKAVYDHDKTCFLCGQSWPQVLDVAHNINASVPLDNRLFTYSDSLTVKIARWVENARNSAR